MKSVILFLILSFLLYTSSNAQVITEDFLLRKTSYSNSFGNDVASAGDVNGDGFMDIVVGEIYYNNDLDGAVHVYYGSQNGFSNSPSWTYAPQEYRAYVGISVDGAGDINGDGYDDIIVGASGWRVNSTGKGNVLVFYGSASGLGSSPNWNLIGDSDGAAMGSDVAGVGDVNGDGYDDILFSAPRSNYDKRGHVWLYYGSSTGVSSNFIFMFGTVSNTRLGESLAAAGDVNGDGYNDIIVGGPGYDAQNVGSGQVRVHYGSQTGITSMPDWVYEAPQGQNTAYHVSGVGDTNGDGFDDIIFTGSHLQKSQKLVLGSSTGLSSSISWSLSNTNFPYSGSHIATKIGDINADGFDDILAASSGSNGYIFLGSSTGPGNSYDPIVQNAVEENFGTSINASTLGDLNGDGIDDFIMGFPDYQQYYPSSGAVGIYYGNTNDDMIESSDWYVEGNLDNANMGHEVANAGDVNGDGWEDILVSAWKYSNGHTSEGAVFLYYGTSSGISDTPGWSAEGNQHNAFFGYGISTAGDVNNDGYDDIIIGAMGYDDGQSNTGRAYIYHGSASRLSSSASLIINGFQVQSYLGSDVANAGDINGDGYDDIIVGAYQYSNGTDKVGAAFLYLGSSTGINIASKDTLVSDQLNSWFGKSVSTAGDINNDGYADVLIGAPKYDSNYTDEGKAYLYLGSGNGIIDTASWSKTGNQYNAQFAFDVSWAGDNNDDGYDDIIIGAYGYDGVSGSLEGRIFGFLGSTSGLSSNADFEAFSQGNINALGKSVAYAGDYDNDGYDDIVVGAESTNSSSGAVLIYQGSSQGLDSIPIYQYEATQTGAKLGTSVSFAGDVNGDGASDFIVGAPNYDHGHSNEGGAFLFYGVNSSQTPPSQPNNEAMLPIEDRDPKTPVYPNPFQNELYLYSETEIESIIMTNLTGKTVSVDFAKTNESGSYIAYVGTLSPQLYLLTIQTKDGKSKRVKVLKK
ncbi:FG-GAP-like repeat-containing protein [Roseivirga sp.]|uniref:FG-GAP-like repeat-containing protein n=1 Tax=Roseivirga sp. TaxID=1964215 RepID=UPI003B51C2F8